MNKFPQRGSDSMSDKNCNVSPENNLPSRSRKIHQGILQCTSEAKLDEMTKLIVQERPNDFFAYVNKSLWQFKLNSKYQVNEIINESYNRAVKKIRKGEDIPNLRGWYKKTSLNIVREYSRIEIKQRKIKESMSASINGELTSKYEESPKYSIEFIKKTINNDLNYKILCLRVLHEKSWKQVCQTLIDDGDFNSELSKQFIDMTKKDSQV